MGEGRPLFSSKKQNLKGGLVISIDTQNALYANLDAHEGVLLNLCSKRYFKLNETSQIIWQMLCDGSAIDDIAIHITQSFDVSHDQALRDVLDFVELLKTESFIIQNKPTFDVANAHDAKLKASKKA